MIKKPICILMTIIMSTLSCQSFVFSEILPETIKDFDVSDILYSDDEILSYDNYIKNFSDVDFGQQNINIPIDSTSIENEGFEISPQIPFLTKVQIEKDALYDIKVDYIPLSGINQEIELFIKLNGQYPFNEGKKIIFSKAYQDDQNKKTDNNGNDIRPLQNEIEINLTINLRDSMGYQTEPFAFYFSKGECIIELGSENGELLLTGFNLERREQAKTYDEYIKNHQEKSDTIGEKIEIPAEYPSLKSSTTIYPQSDKFSASVDPIARGKIKFNIIGQSGFNKSGQWAVYDFNVKKDGFYYIDFKYKQNQSIGTSSFRRVLIDDKILFEEMERMEFEYSNSWKRIKLGGKTPKKIYLNEGSHSLKVEVTLGPYSEVLKEIMSTTEKMNTAYRESVMFLSATPDLYRDYDVENNLSQVIENFKSEVISLDKISSMITEISGRKNEKTALIDKFSQQLKNLIKKPETLPKRLEQFKGNLTSLASLISTFENQPVILDTISIISTDVVMPNPQANILKSILNQLHVFITTFFVDYSSIGNIYTSSDSIEVWIPSGRDQASVLKRMIDDNFSSKKDIGVNLKLVTSTMLLPAITSNLGPDVMLQIGNSEPVNYAIRGAITNLTQFEDYKEVLSSFAESAITPLVFENKLYGLPETQSFYMMFYRKDILNALNITPPETWDETVQVISKLQKKNLYFGLPQGTNTNLMTLGMFLYQNDSQFYEKDTYLSALNSEVAIQSFSYLTNLFINYKMLLTYDALTMFRIGEMPVLINDYSFYNSIQVAAPELRDLWDITFVPGVKQENGVINRSVVSSGLSCMILSQSNKEKSSWEFLKWWTGTDAQIDYGREMESLLGTSARVNTANIKAAENLPWSRQNAKMIKEQREWAKGIESVPGGYFTTRHIDNAFRKAVFSLIDTREVLNEYIRVINREIETKCNEFGINITRNNYN